MHLWRLVSMLNLRPRPKLNPFFGPDRTFDQKERGQLLAVCGRSYNLRVDILNLDFSVGVTDRLFIKEHSVSVL